MIGARLGLFNKEIEMSVKDPEVEKITERIFREIYVPYYPSDSPLEGLLTQYESGLQKQIRTVVQATINILKESK